MEAKERRSRCLDLKRKHEPSSEGRHAASAPALRTGRTGPTGAGRTGGAPSGATAMAIAAMARAMAMAAPALDTAPSEKNQARPAYRRDKPRFSVCHASIVAGEVYEGSALIITTAKPKSGKARARPGNLLFWLQLIAQISPWADT